MELTVATLLSNLMPPVSFQSGDQFVNLDGHAFQKWYSETLPATHRPDDSVLSRSDRSRLTDQANR